MSSPRFWLSQGAAERSGYVERLKITKTLGVMLEPIRANRSSARTDQFAARDAYAH